MITTKLSRRDMLRIGMAGTAASVAGLTLPGLFPKKALASDPESVQVAEIYQLQAAFHQAKSHQDIDLMMSLWAPDATVTFNGNFYDGSDQIRALFLSTGSWKHHRISLVPSFKDQIQVHGNEAFLYFECHDIALTDESASAPAGAVVTHLCNFGTIRNLNGSWVFQTMHFGSAAPISVDTIYDT